MATQESNSTMTGIKATPAAQAPLAEPVVSIRHLSKSFGPVQANKDINLDIRPGRIKALLGENGAGKSTLMSMLSGRFPPDGGDILVDGKKVFFRSPKDGLEAGIGMVYQHFMLVYRMTVAENVLLGQTKAFFVSPKKMQAEVGALAREFGLDIDPAARVGDLSMGERQRVEILKLLYRKSRVLIFDEPTAVLTPSESRQLFDALRHMASLGKAIVFISHKLPEVMDVADEIAILRSGSIVDEFLEHEVPSEKALANRMVGRDVLLEIDHQAVEPGPEILELDGLTGQGMDNLHLTLRQGEIVAVAGVAGNGQKPLVETVCGLIPPEQGGVRILGTPWRAFYKGGGRGNWRGALSYIPEDRQGLAALPNLGMVDNILLTTRQGFTKRLMLQRDKAAGATKKLIARFNVQPARTETLARQLSGGNLQKLVLAREFFRDPRIIVAEQPTQGLDVSATEEVWRQLLAAREQAGVLLITGDLNEAMQLADRIVVMYRGAFMGEVHRKDGFEVDQIGLLMAGVNPEG